MLRELRGRVDVLDVLWENFCDVERACGHKGLLQLGSVERLVDVRGAGVSDANEGVFHRCRGLRQFAGGRVRCNVVWPEAVGVVPALRGVDEAILHRCVQSCKESKLQKAVDAANKLIAKLRAEIDSLKQEISDYKSVHSKLRAAELEHENTELRGKVRSYEEVIQRNNLWRFFHPLREKAVTRDEAR